MTTLRLYWSDAWTKLKAGARLSTSRKTLEYLAVTFLVFAVHPLIIILPSIDWLPSNESTNLFLGTLWQVHATIIGITVIVVTIIITVVANEGDRSRIWNLYSERGKIALIVWFNLSLIVGEGLAFLETLQVASPIIFADGEEILALVAFVLFVISMLVVFRVLLETLRFLNQDYVENLFEEQITKAMSQGIANDLRRIREFNQRLLQDIPDES